MYYLQNCFKCNTVLAVREAVDAIVKVGDFNKHPIDAKFSLLTITTE